MLDLILGNTKIQSRVLLAPMAGVTDLPFRKIVREFGNFLMYSEMVASQAVIRNVKRTHKMMDSFDDPMTSVQIVGADPIVMAEAAKLAEDMGARFLDINMGCPVKKIVKSDSGSALMRNEVLAGNIMESVVKTVKIPVTLKTRLGWDNDHRNAPNIARIAESSGIQMISIHGRTRSQLYSGHANWKEIRNVKESVKIPVIANGDIVDLESAKQALEDSGSDGLMIGRGALGSPWLLLDIHNMIEGIDSTVQITTSQKYELAKRHLNYMFEFYEESTSIKLARKILMHYCKGFKDASKYRQEINTFDSKNSIFELLQKMFML